MIFRRRRSSTGRHRGLSQKELKALELQPKAEPVISEQASPTFELALEDVSEIEAFETLSEEDVATAQESEAQARRSYLPVGSSVEKPIEFLAPKDTFIEELPSLPSSTDPVAEDELSRKAYLLLMEIDAPDDVFNRALSLLATRSSIINRLRVLNRRVEALAADALEYEFALDEMKLEQHIESLDAKNSMLDEDESEAETLESLEGFAVKRNQLQKSVLLLAKLEVTRSSLVDEYKQLIEEFVGLLPQHSETPLEQEIKHLISNDLEVFSSIQNHATSDGEWVGTSETALSEIEDFLAELESHQDEPLMKHDGDSVFHLD